MNRTSRLFELIQLLRRHRHAVSAHILAVHLGVSVRTVYRDIETLRQQGADIRGEAGIEAGFSTAALEVGCKRNESAGVCHPLAGAAA